MNEQTYYRASDALPVNHKLRPLTAEDVMAEVWIPVTERIPKPGQAVQVFFKGKGHGSHIQITWLAQDGTGFIHENLYGKVTHWLPLVPPQEVKDG